MFAFTHVSNTLGTINPVREMVQMLKAAGAISVKSYNQPRREQRQQEQLGPQQEGDRLGDVAAHRLLGLGQRCPPPRFAARKAPEGRSWPAHVR